MSELSPIQLYEYIYERKWVRSPKWKMEDIAQSLKWTSRTTGKPLDRKASQKKYKSLCKKLNKQYRPDKKKLKNSASMKVDRESKPYPEVKLVLGEILPKYGQIPPTFYISPLDNDAWIDKYVQFDFDLIEVDFETEEEYKQAIEKEKAKWIEAVETYLSEFRTFIWDSDEGLALLPRRYGKTESIFALFVRWFAEIRSPIYCVVPSESHARDTLNRVTAIMRMDVFRRDYGDIIGGTSYNMEMKFIRYHDDFKWNRFNNPLSIVTWFSAKEGRGAGWIHFEDVFQREAKSIEVIKDVEYRFNKTFAKMRTRVGKRKTKMTFTGTRYEEKDFYAYIMGKRKVPVHHVICLEDDLKTWTKCPNYTLEDLLIDRSLDLWSFETSMNNNPIPHEGNVMKQEWLKIAIIPEKFIGARKFVQIIVDPSFGKSAQSSKTAIICSFKQEGLIFVNDIVVLESSEYVDIEIERLKAKFKTDDSYIEDDFFQISTRYDLSKRLIKLGVRTFTNSRQGEKEARIGIGLRDNFRLKQIKIFDNCIDLTKFRREYLKYNNNITSKEKFDILDAMASAFRISKFGIKDTKSPPITMVG